jgi:hypothetical protein
MTLTDDFSSDVKEFLDRNIDSIEQLEVLLLLWKNAGRHYQPLAVVNEIASSPDSISQRLRTLVTIGLVSESPNGFRYKPDQSHDVLVEKVANVYSERRVSLISYLISKSVRSFSDGFRSRDPKKE